MTPKELADNFPLEILERAKVIMEAKEDGTERTKEVCI